MKQKLRKKIMNSLSEVHDKWLAEGRERSEDNEIIFAHRMEKAMKKFLHAQEIVDYTAEWDLSGMFAFLVTDDKRPVGPRVMFRFNPFPWFGDRKEEDK